MIHGSIAKTGRYIEHMDSTTSRILKFPSSGWWHRLSSKKGVIVFSSTSKMQLLMISRLFKVKKIHGHIMLHRFSPAFVNSGLLKLGGSRETLYLVLVINFAKRQNLIVKKPKA